jgi:putative acetyltransferase
MDSGPAEPTGPMSGRPPIRPALPQEREGIVALVREAFSAGGGDGAEEVQIVVDTWASARHLPGLELVAVEGGAVVGHVLTALGDLGGGALPAVAPLAVAPARQGHGIGSALMTEVLVRAERAGYPALFVLGSHEYYGRFGFEPAGPLGVTYPPAGPSSPHFQIRRLAGYDPSLRGEFLYCFELGRR